MSTRPEDKLHPNFQARNVPAVHVLQFSFHDIQSIEKVDMDNTNLSSRFDPPQEKPPTPRILAAVLQPSVAQTFWDVDAR